MDSKRMRTRAPPYVAPAMNGHYPAARQSALRALHAAPGKAKGAMNRIHGAFFDDRQA